MTDARTGTADDDRLPWLEAVDEEEGNEGPSPVKLIAAVVIGLVAIGLVVAGLFWIGNRGGPGEGDGELIEAPEGAYKVAPEQPGGMQVEGQGGSAHAASQGQEVQGNLNMNVPERPVAPSAPAPQTQAPAQPAAPPAAAPRPAPARPAPAPAPAAPRPAAGPTIQLGAFSTQAAANRAWTALSGRFRYLAPLSHSIIPVRADVRTLYRLRASGPNSADICRRLEIAGESCAVVR
jgi:cell division septation protein DedD